MSIKRKGKVKVLSNQSEQDSRWDLLTVPLGHWERRPNSSGQTLHSFNPAVMQSGQKHVFFSTSYLQ